MEQVKLSQEEKEEKAREISVFLHKHIANPEFVIIVENYEFEILRCLDVPSINPDSINSLNDGCVQFNGTALIIKEDPKSKISTNQAIRFQGHAFYQEAIDGEIILYKILLHRIIQEKNEK